MNPVRGGFSNPRGCSSTVAMLLLALFLGLCTISVTANSVSPVDHRHHYVGCDLIQSVLNGTAASPDSTEGGLDHWHNHKDLGSICRGRCCSHRAETQLGHKSTHDFRQTLRHHTKSLHTTLAKTAKIFREHLMDLSAQSESKTLHLFSQVYGNLAPYSRRTVAELYDNIRSRLKRHPSEGPLDIEKSVNNFFAEFYPVVYHHVLLADEDSDFASTTATTDFQADYKKCIKHIFDDVQPFGDVPRTLARALQQSVGAADVFLRSLEQGASVLESVEQLDEGLFGAKCTSHLVKMNYCQECNGSRKVKTCHGYCLNVMRGCLTQYVGSLDRPWASFALAVEQLMHMVRSREGIESVLRSLDGHLSEAIMQAMQNGPRLENKVKQLCGSATMVAAKKEHLLPSEPTNQTPETVNTVDADMIQFLVTIENSQEFYSNIVNSYCNEPEFQQDDKSCWTGDRIAEYSNTVMPTGISSQKYNPEVPYSADEFRSKFEVNELGDKLTNLKQSISIAMTKYSDRLETADNEMQSDMAEGSAWGESDPNFDFPEASGSGSGPVLTPTIPPAVTQSPPIVGREIPGKPSFGVSLHGCSWMALLVASALCLFSR